MKLLFVFAALIGVSLAIIAPRPIKRPPIRGCNCNCPENPFANTSDNPDIICHCPPCPTCNCEPCRVPVETIAEAPINDETGATEQLLPLPPGAQCKCAACPPTWNPPECNCEGACPLIRCYCPECAAV